MPRPFLVLSYDRLMRKFVVETYVEARRENGTTYQKYVPGDVISYEEAERLGLVDAPKRSVRTTKGGSNRRTTKG